MINPHVFHAFYGTVITNDLILENNQLYSILPITRLTKRNLARLADTIYSFNSESESEQPQCCKYVCRLHQRESRKLLYTLDAIQAARADKLQKKFVSGILTV